MPRCTARLSCFSSRSSLASNHHCPSALDISHGTMKERQTLDSVKDAQDPCAPLCFTLEATKRNHATRAVIWAFSGSHFTERFRLPCKLCKVEDVCQ